MSLIKELNETHIPGMWDSDRTVDELLEKINKAGWSKGLDMVYMWVKQGHINKTQFTKLVKHLTRE